MQKSNLIKSLLLLISFSIIFSSLITIGYSHEVSIPNGLVVNHIYRISMTPEHFPSNFTYTIKSNELIHVDWLLGGPHSSFEETGSWDVNINTRVVSNMLNFGPDNGDSGFTWIYTNISLNDQFLMFNFFSNTDHLFNVTGEVIHGSMEVWQLEDAEGSVVWYEKTLGFLVNGTFRYQSGWQSYEFIDYSVPPPQESGIPGYSYFLLFGAFFGIGIILIKHKLRKALK